TPGPGGAVAADDGPGWRLGAGGRHPEVLRHAGSRSSARVAQATGTRRGAVTPDRQVAERGGLGGGDGDVPEYRLAAGRGDLPSLGQRLPALRAGRLVVPGGEAAPEGTCLPDPLRRRLRNRLRVRGGRAARAGSLAEAVRQVRLEPPPGQD